MAELALTEQERRFSSAVMLGSSASASSTAAPTSVISPATLANGVADTVMSSSASSSAASVTSPATLDNGVADAVMSSSASSSSAASAIGPTTLAFLNLEAPRKDALLAELKAAGWSMLIVPRASTRCSASDTYYKPPAHLAAVATEVMRNRLVREGHVRSIKEILWILARHHGKQLPHKLPHKLTQPTKKPRKRPAQDGKKNEFAHAGKRARRGVAALPPPRQEITIGDDDADVPELERILRTAAASAHPLTFAADGRVVDPSPGGGLSGLARFTLNDEAAVKCMQDFCEELRRKGQPVNWEGGMKPKASASTRCFGLPPGVTYAFMKKNGVDLRDGGLKAQDRIEYDRQANKRACVECSELPGEVTRAAGKIATLMRDAVADSEREHVALDKVLAYQPNFHGRKRALNFHADCPLHDGFGRVIVTIGLIGSATILLRTIRQPKQVYKFDVAAGQVYCLSGAVRYQAEHAVLGHRSAAAVAGVRSRERDVRVSMNIRFGLDDTESVRALHAVASHACR